MVNREIYPFSGTADAGWLRTNYQRGGVLDAQMVAQSPIIELVHLSPSQAPHFLNKSAGQTGGKSAFRSVELGQPKPLSLALDAHHVGAATLRVYRIGPGLHHFPALLQVGGVVVGVADFVVVAVG